MKIIQSIVAMISRLSTRERLVLYVTVFIISALFLDRLILSPILSKIGQLDEALRLQREAIEQSLLIVTQEKKIESESGRFAPYLSDPQSEEKEVTAFLQEVEVLAKKSSVYLIDIKPAGKDSGEKAWKYFVKLNFEAQMEQVINFFHGVTNFDKLIRIENYQLKPKSEGSTIINCSVSISKSIIPQ